MSLSQRVGTALKVTAGVLVATVVITLTLAVYLFNVSQTLPNLEVDPRALDTPQTSVVYASDGTVIAEWHGEQDRTIVSYKDMPIHLRNAVVAAEDRRFWEHNGVDVEGIIRALRANTQAGEVRQGGSTITQQLVKLLFTEGERTLDRKVREALLAYEFEARADKDRVLETYLNTVYFGNGAYGVESAARRYFGQSTSALSLAESATLAGIIRSPTRYDPTNDPEAARRRRDLVLTLMREQGYITRDELQGARKDGVKLAPKADVPTVAPHFVEYVKRDLVERLGSERVFAGGLRVHTTLEPSLQRLAEKSARLLNRPDDPETAIVALRHSDGSVLAMVGGRDFSKSQFNLATQGRRQPGSAFKTFVLVAALEKGVNPQKVYSAAPYSVRVKDGVWRVQNYENARTSGKLTLRAATSWSVNAVYARLIMEVGPKKVVEVAKRLGITTPLNADPAIALGGLKTGVSPLEMASAYGTLANGGMRVAPSGVTKVTDDQGAVIYEPDAVAERVVDSEVALKTALILHDVIEKGTGTSAKIGAWAAGKTGTTQSHRDAWFVGWSGDVSTAVWVGYPDAQVDMTNVHGTRVTGGSFPAKIWAAFMRGVKKNRSAPIVTAPSVGNQVRVTVCTDSMNIANRRCPRPVEIYLEPGRVPGENCTLH
ncbi:MAG: PBP1A family penicillin-binding protein [Coriobacteriia bacterium]|nr:PBP1A family penicillin-binding protein [Coriobacteriia bacterium]